MASGKYSVLTGAIAREQQMANISANLANINTIGYKKNRMSFESILRGEQQTTKAKGINYNRIRNNFTEFSEGAMRGTGNPLDVAIYGDGFFKIQTPDGVQYTRRGDFHVDRTGLLLTGNNLPVLDDGNAPIIIPDSDSTKISVNSLGDISTLSTDGTRNVVGSIGITTINDNKFLKRETDTLFSLEEEGRAVPVDEPNLAVGSLELSNINMTKEMAQMIDTNRAFESYHKVMKNYSRLGQKQDELGTIG